MIGLYGGAFDPPHNGHVALARTAVDHFGLRRLVVVVATRPGHKDVHCSAETRLRLADLAFPYEVVLDDHERTVDLLRAGRWRDPLFLIGADEFCDFPTWKEPDAVLELARLGVATRPGFPRERLEEALATLTRPERVLFFELEPLPISSTEVRERAARGEPIDHLVPAEVARYIREHDLYRAVPSLDSRL